MSVLAVLATLVLHLVASLGLGAVTLRLSAMLPRLHRAEAWAWAFALGQGLWGWLVFWLAASQILAAPALIGLGLVASTGLLVLVRNHNFAASPAATPLHPGLALLALLPLLMLGLEAVSPPSDADSLAYHFALARDFTRAGGLVFLPRAIDAAVPLMMQMGYTSSFALGGEAAMTGWAALLSLGTMAVLYTSAQRWLERNWAMALTLVFATLPATVYGAGCGQVEVKLGMVIMVAGLALAEALRRDNWRAAMVAGAAVGIFVASKYTGLLFAAIATLPLLAAPSRLRLVTAFVTSGFVVGCQWYGWNWLNSGDPLFPMLHPWLAPDSPMWPHSYHLWHQANWALGEIELSRSLQSLLAYPFLATFGPPPSLDSARVGIGFGPMALLPFALVGLTVLPASTRPLLGRPLATLALVVAGFCLVWFFVGPSQRVRHYLPILPATLLVMTVAAEGLTRAQPARWALKFALAAAIALQLVGQAVYSQRYAADLLHRASRDSSLEKAVSYYDAIRWVNEHLRPTDKVVFESRFLNYLVEIPYYNAHPTNQALVDMSPGGNDPALFYRQLCVVKATHVLTVAGRREDLRDYSTSALRLRELERLGRARLQITIDSRFIESRTLRQPPASIPIQIFALSCPANLAAPDEIR